MTQRSRIHIAVLALLVTGLWTSAIHASPSTLFRGVGPAPRRIPVRLETNKTQYAIGERMGIRVASATEGHLILYYVDSGGHASIITPSPYSKHNRMQAGQWHYVVDDEGGLLLQTGPSGSESLHALVTRDPIDPNRFADLLSVSPNGIWSVRDPQTFLSNIEACLIARNAAAERNEVGGRDASLGLPEGFSMSGSAPPRAAFTAPPNPPGDWWSRPNVSEGAGPYDAPVPAGAVSIYGVAAVSYTVTGDIISPMTPAPTGALPLDLPPPPRPSPTPEATPLSTPAATPTAIPASTPTPSSPVVESKEFPKVTIESPTANAVVTDSALVVKGTVKGTQNGQPGGQPIDHVELVVGGHAFPAAVTNEHFEQKVLLGPGDNVVVARAKNAAGTIEESVKVKANIEATILKIVMAWGGNGTDVDLHVTDPGGRITGYADPIRPGVRTDGRMLNWDLTHGPGTETFTMTAEVPGTYTVRLDYYRGDSPENVNVTYVVREGTPQERKGDERTTLAKGDHNRRDGASNHTFTIVVPPRQ